VFLNRALHGRSCFFWIHSVSLPPRTQRSILLRDLCGNSCS
jgi:hypothetical protein